MHIRFIIGSILAISAGVSTYLGEVLQKVAVAKMPVSYSESKYKYLFRNITWVMGLVLYIVLATVFYMAAQLFIGPVLIPGLMALGLIALVIASVHIAKEHLSLWAVVGITVLGIGAFFIAFSKLIINYEDVSLDDKRFVIRAMAFTLTSVLVWIVLDIASLRFSKLYAKRRIYCVLCVSVCFVMYNFDSY